MWIVLKKNLYLKKKRNTEEIHTHTHIYIHTHTLPHTHTLTHTHRKYMETYREDLLQEAMEITRPSRNANKILWWKQEYITKEDMTALTNFWFK